MKRNIYKLLAGDRFFYFILGLLIFQAVWLALTGRYPMAFDEDFHLGIIKLYAHHLSPWWSHEPPYADAFGAVTRDPSYLYQYLLSFPYRLLQLITGSQTAQVIALRVINIALFTSSLPLYRRLLDKLRAPRALSHVVLLLFVLIPIVPFLAAQINYDNLLLPVMAASLLLALRVTRDLQTDHRVNMGALASLIIICVFASLIKYAFLPIFIAILIFVALYLWRYLVGKHKFWSSFSLGWNHLRPRWRWLYALLFLVGLLLFSERYGINLIRYHTPVPDCGQVLSYQHCSAYGPWIRDYNYALQKTPASHNPLSFTMHWFSGMWMRLFFAVDGPGTHFQTRGPLVMPGIGAVILSSLGLLASLKTLPRLLRRYDKRVLLLLALVTILYVLALWVDEYREFLHAGTPVAINGRYLLPVLPWFMAVLALGCKELLRGRYRWQAALATVAIVCFIWGGGFLTYVIRSNDAWYWPNPIVRNTNHALQRVLKPVVPGSSHPTEYLF